MVGSKIKDASYCAYARMEELRCTASLCIIILALSQPIPTVVIRDIYRHEVSKSRGPAVKKNQVSFYENFICSSQNHICRSKLVLNTREKGSTLYCRSHNV